MPARWPGDARTIPARAAAGGGFESDFDTPAPGTLQHIFSDDFASGDLSKTENGFTWGGGFRFDPSTDNPLTGTHSLKATYLADEVVDPANTNGFDSFLERRFNLGALYTTVLIEFDLYVPDGTEPWGGPAFTVRTPPDGGGINNKFLRLWGDDLGSPNTYGTSGEKVGLSYFPDASSVTTITPDFSQPNTGAIGSNQPDVPLVDAADLGTWISIKIEIKAPTQEWATTAESDGYMKLTKNETVLFDRPVNSYEDDPGYNHAYQAGYLLGWANTGFAEETYLFIDNVKFSGVLK